MLAQLTSPADRFALIIAVLCRAASARIGRGPAGARIILIWTRLHRIAARFASLAARVRAGRLAPRPAAPRAGRKGGPHDPAKRLPETFGWLVRLVPDAAAGASQLRHLLADPDMAALIAAAPQAGRILRPLCRMLGVVPPPGLALPARPRTPPAPIQPAAPAAPPPAAPPSA